MRREEKNQIRKDEIEKEKLKGGIITVIVSG